MHAALIGCAILALASWVASLVSGNCSWVDRGWSILPPAYVGYFAWSSAFHPRLVLMGVFTVAWGARLTFNFARKGGYRPSSEDYRWAALRERLSPALFEGFRLLFISVLQNLVLLSLALPAWVASMSSRRLGVLDAVAGALFALFFVGEAVADQQQWNFQKARASRKARGEKGDEFLTTGLFRYSRHPNFFCEQAIWCSFWLFTLASGARTWNIGLVGPVALIAVFLGSTPFTEQLTLARHPHYADYQRRTSRLWPWFPSG